MPDRKQSVPAGSEGGKRAGTDKKAVLLRLNSRLYDELAAWSEEEFRSVNGQIEYLLTETVRQHRQEHRPQA